MPPMLPVDCEGHGKVRWPVICSVFLGTTQIHLESKLSAWVCVVIDYRTIWNPNLESGCMLLLTSRFCHTLPSAHTRHGSNYIHKNIFSFPKNCSGRPPMTRRVGVFTPHAFSVPFCCLLVHPVRNIVNVIGPELLTEGRHAVFAIGHLVLDCIDIVASCQVLFNSLLFDFLL